ncbi:DUF6623 family protein [Nonomuraea sp. NPDC004297]
MAEKLHSSWVPGYAAFPENAGLRTFRQAFGVTFTIPPNGTEWIHLPIPTPVILANDRANLDKVLILLHTRLNTSVIEVSVWDGPIRVFLNTNMDLRGDWSQGLKGPLESGNVFHVQKTDVRYGINVTLRVRNLSPTGDGEFSLTSFGGDFFHNA